MIDEEDKKVLCIVTGENFDINMLEQEYTDFFAQVHAKFRVEYDIVRHDDKEDDDKKRNKLLLNRLDREYFNVVVFGVTNERECQIAKKCFNVIFQRFPTCFNVALFSPDDFDANSSNISITATIRWELMQYNANMITNDLKQLKIVLGMIAFIGSHRGSYKCKYCNMDKLGEDDLVAHCSLYHINKENKNAACSICGKKDNYQVHLRNAHGPAGRGEIVSEYNTNRLEIYAFALVVCQREKDGKFLVVQEFCSSGFWLPGGRVDAGEDLRLAAIRETKEEAGVDVDLQGVLRVEYSPREKYVRMRVIFFARPFDENQPSKSIPDYESVASEWVDFDEIQNLPLRGSEPLEWFKYIVDGKPIFPLTVLTREDEELP